MVKFSTGNNALEKVFFIVLNKRNIVNVAIDFQNDDFLIWVLISIVVRDDLVKIAVQNCLLDIFKTHIPSVFQKLIFRCIPLKFLQFQSLIGLKKRISVYSE